MSETSEAPHHLQHLMANRRGLVVGIANKRSLAFGIARAARQAGAKLIVSYQSDRLERSVRPLADELEAVELVQCDLGDDHELVRLRERVEARFGALDFVVHAAAFARREELQGRFVSTSRDGFDDALRASCYSLVALVRAMHPLLLRGELPSVLTLTYLGAERALPNYNVMGVAKAALEASVRYLAHDLGPEGIRVNALSAGPVRTLSAAAISGLRDMLELVAQSAPLRRNVDVSEVGEAALFVLSALGRGTTGEVFHVDGGYHAIGAPMGTKASGDSTSVSA